MHSQYDEEFNCGADERVLVVSTPNKEALGITSEMVRVHEAILWKEKSWKREQKIKVLKGACSGSQNSNMCAIIDYFILEGFQGDVGAEGRVICRPLGVAEHDGCVLTVDGAGTHLDLCSSKSMPITVIGSVKMEIISYLQHFVFIVVQRSITCIWRVYNMFASIFINLSRC